MGCTVATTQKRIFPFTSISAAGMLNCATLFRSPSSRVTIPGSNLDLSAPLGSDGDTGTSLWKRTSMTSSNYLARLSRIRPSCRIEFAKGSQVGNFEPIGDKSDYIHSAGIRLSRSMSASGFTARSIIRCNKLSSMPQSKHSSITLTVLPQQPPATACPPNGSRTTQPG